MKQESRDRLVRHIDFLEQELNDHGQFKNLSHGEYLKERNKRRNVERWVENIINSTVDISRVILTIEGIPIPDTYRGIVATVSVVEGLETAGAVDLSKWVRFRNIIAHDYLDIKWNTIKRFIDEADKMYTGFVNSIKAYLKNKLPQEY